MKRKTANGIKNSLIYKIYRRIRYIRYVKKVRKKRKKQKKLEKLYEDQEFKQNLKKQRRTERRLNKIRQKERKIEQRRLKNQIRAELKQKIQLEKELAKRKALLDKEEKEKKKAEIKSRLKEKAIRDKTLELKKKYQSKKEKLERRKRIRELRPYLLKRRFRELKYGIRSINRETLIRWFRWFIAMIESKDDRKMFFGMAVNSLSLFILAYLVLYILGEVITLSVAQSFEYNTIWYYFKIYYNIDSDQWTADAVKILYSIKPATGVILGTIAMIIYSTIRNENTVFKMFFLWLFIHGMVMFFGSLLMGTLLNQGFGWVIAYLYYKDTGKMIFSILAIFALGITGTSTARSFLISGNAYFNFIGSENRKVLLVSQILIPMIIGSTIIALLKIPPEYYYTTREEVVFEVLKLSTIIIITIPMVLTFSAFTEIYFDEEPRKIRVKWIYFLASLAVYFTFWIALQNGIEFII